MYSALHGASMTTAFPSFETIQQFVAKLPIDDKILILTADPEAASLIIDRFNIAKIYFETVDIERLGDSPFSGKAFIPDCEIYVYYRDYETSELILNDVFKEIVNKLGE